MFPLRPLLLVPFLSTSIPQLVHFRQVSDSVCSVHGALHCFVAPFNPFLMASPTIWTTLRVLAFVLIISAQWTWYKRVNELVPVPYLDEVFHIPQVQRYATGSSQWDPKITTPPGTYWLSVVLLQCRKLLGLSDATVSNAPRGKGVERVIVSVPELRAHSTVLWYSVAILLGSFGNWIEGDYGSDPNIDLSNVLASRTLAIMTFPLSFFFSALYYTDMASTWSVVVAYIAYSISSTARSRQVRLVMKIVHLLSGLMACSMRQTNILWVAVFPAGLEAVRSIKRNVGAHNVHDPPVAEVYFEGQTVSSF